MSHTRAAFMITLALSSIAWPAASADDPPPAVWPVETAWSNAFPIGGEFTLVMGDSRLFIVEPHQILARAWIDGGLLWTSGLSATAQPVFDEGRVFIAAGEAIHALSEVSGHEEWRLPVGAVSISPTTRSGWLIVASDDGTLRGFSTSEGRAIWQIALPAPLTGPVVIVGDLVVGAGVDGRIRGWQILDGALRWTREVGTKPMQLLAASGYVFVGGEDGRLISLRQRDGQLNWAYRLGMPIVGRLAADERHVYFTTVDNSVHAHTFNGHQAWRQLLAFRVVDGLFADAGTVFVPQSSGEVRMYVARRGVRSGRLVSSREEGNVLGSLVAGGTGNEVRMAITTSAGAGLSVTAYHRRGLGAVPATSAPPGTPLELTLPGGRP